MNEQQTQTFELQRYIERKIDLTLEQRREARLKLEELSKTGLGVERLPAENLAQALANAHYPKISPEFLRQNQLASEIKIRVPKFGVYSLDDPHMIMKLERGEFGNCNFEIAHPKGVPEILVKELLFATEYGKDVHPELWSHYIGGSRRYSGSFSKRGTRLPKEIERIAYVMGSSFYGFIPDRTKQEVSEAKTIFGDRLFLIAETKPEDWTLTKIPRPRIVKDPLILGIIANKCYLVDHFDTSPVEDYARREFTS